MMTGEREMAGIFAWESVTLYPWFCFGVKPLVLRVPLKLKNYCGQIY